MLPKAQFSGPTAHLIKRIEICTKAENNVKSGKIKQICNNYI